jgi:type IV secretion system protein VirD4
MQLPPDDELVLVSGCQPIRAKKARYFEDPELSGRIRPPPVVGAPSILARNEVGEVPHTGDWTGAVVAPPTAASTEDPANAGIRREPELPEHEEIAPEPRRPVHEFEPADEDADDEPQRRRMMQRSMGAVARQISLDPADDMHM